MNKMSHFTPCPKSPIHTPQPGSSSKTIQLTPIWEEVIKNNRLPPDVNLDLIFKEISVRLEDLEWPVRQHAFRVLYDIISVISNDRLDERIIQNNILSKLVINLGHPAPGIRKVAMETIQKFFRQTSQSEKMLEDFLQYGVKEKDLLGFEGTGILRENITLGTIISLVEVLKPFISPENNGYAMTKSFLTKVIEALASKVKNSLYQDKCLETLQKLSDMIGEEVFCHILENIPDREFVITLMNYRVKKDDHKEEFPDKSIWSDETKSEDETKSDNSEEIAIKDNDSIDFYERMVERNAKLYKEKSFIVSNESSEECTDGTDTETYTKEPVPNDLEDDQDLFYQVNPSEVKNFSSQSFVAIDDFNENFKSKNMEKYESFSSSPRVLLEAEIQFTKNKAISMKFMEEDKEVPKNDKHIEQFENKLERFTDKEGDLISQVLHNKEDIEEEEKTRTPRRVRFGGEVIKLRTPDSETTDITIEIHEAEDKTKEIESECAFEKQKILPERDKIDTKLSLIPVPVTPASKSPRGIPSPIKREKDLNSSEKMKNEISQVIIEKDNYLQKYESFEPTSSSSGSEGDVKQNLESNEEGKFWEWNELRLVEENIIKDLRNKENWKIQFQALEQLKTILINPKIIDKIGKINNEKQLHSLFNFLLHKFRENNNQQIIALALSIVSQMIETIPKDIIILLIEDIVEGLCRYFGGSKNINLKIESVQSLKTLFGIIEPSTVMDVLTSDKCLFSSSSKLRENSLLAIMYATMMFPSTSFDMDKIIEKVANSTSDPRRRVRHAALEAVAVLSQFCSSKTLTDNIAKVAEKLPTPTCRANLIAATQARLSRRLLPKISSEGLVLYALQIPASRRFGNVGNPMGADVDWILSGTGSISTGSAKSRTQLNAAQRLDIKPKAPLSPSKWSQRDSENLPDLQQIIIPKVSGASNPWTIQKNRNENFYEATKKNQKGQDPHFNKTHSFEMSHLITNKENIGENFKLSERDKRVRPEDITWALVPVEPLEQPTLNRERSNSLWGDSSGEGNLLYLSSPSGQLRPLYLKVQPNHEQFLLTRSSDDVRKNFFSLGPKRGSDRFNQEDSNEIRLLTPTVLRDKILESYHPNGKTLKNEVRSSNESVTKIPVIQTSKNNQKHPRTIYVNERKKDVDDSVPNSQKHIKINSVLNGLSETPYFFPSIYPSQTELSYNLQKSPVQNKLADFDEIKLQDTMTQLSGLLVCNKEANKLGKKDVLLAKNQTSDVNFKTNGDFTEKISKTDNIVLEDKNKLCGNVFIKNQDVLPAVTSAPPIISSEPRNQTPSTSSSNSTEVGNLSESEMRLQRLATGSGNLDLQGNLNHRNYNTYNPKLKVKKVNPTKTTTKTTINGISFPENLKPHERPKENLETCLNQLQSQQWEVNMVGLTSLVRLLRYHPAIILSQLHPFIVALSQQIKNLRSQVARAACQASAEMFLNLKRNVEPDLDELSGPLFHRSADTNRFIRADCNLALDNMADNVGPAKVVNVIISKGTTHQNATVRAVAARLLLRLSERVGPEKLLSLPKEIRDKMMQAGANLLTEGKLETRAFAKQVFRVWSTHPCFTNIMMEAVSPNVIRNISKVLISLKS